MADEKDTCKNPGVRLRSAARRKILQRFMRRHRQHHRNRFAIVVTRNVLVTSNPLTALDTKKRGAAARLSFVSRLPEPGALETGSETLMILHRMFESPGTLLITLLIFKNCAASFGPFPVFVFEE